MKLKIDVPIEKTFPRDGWHSFRNELREVNAKYIERISANRKRTAFYYRAHYERVEDEVYAYNDSRFKGLAKANIDRKINKLNPKQFNFIDDVCAL